MGGDAVLIETEQDGLGLDPVDGDADDVGDTGVGVAHAADPVDRGGRLEQPARLPPGRGSFGLQHAGGADDAGGGAETEDGGDVLEPGAPGPLLFAADQEGIEAEPPPHDQRTHAGRAPHLWALTDRRSASRSSKASGR